MACALSKTNSWPINEQSDHARITCLLLQDKFRTVRLLRE